MPLFTGSPDSEASYSSASGDMNLVDKGPMSEALEKLVDMMASIKEQIAVVQDSGENNSGLSMFSEKDDKLTELEADLQRLQNEAEQIYNKLKEGTEKQDKKEGDQQPSGQ